jgi:ribosomal protein S21
MRPYLKKPSTKIGLVEWLKVKVLNSSPSAAKKKKKKETKKEKEKKKNQKSLLEPCVGMTLC